MLQISLHIATILEANVKTPRLLCTALLAILLLGSSLPAPPRARFREPLTFQGNLRYSEHGPGASVDGIGTALFVGGMGAPVAVARITSGLRAILSLPGVGDNPSMKSVSDMLNNGVPIDIAALIPGTARYTANVRFSLEEGDDGVLHLREGSLTWTNTNQLEFSYDGGTITDSFGGSGSYILDPSKDTVDLSFDRSTEPMSLELKVDISHPTPTSGKSVWNALGGAVTIQIDSTNGEQVWSGQSMGQPIPPMPSGGGPAEHGIYYYRKGTISDLSGRETWRNLLDAQVVAEWEIVDACSAYIDVPSENGNLTYKDDADGTLEVDAAAHASPEAWGEDLEWTFPEIAGSDLTADPENRRGTEVTFTYEGLPSKNADFGRKEVGVEFRELADRCENPPKRAVKVFWDLDATNNPDGSVPNWFYYWKQTRAAQGHGDAILLDSSCPYWGYFDGYDYPDKANVIYLCDWGEGPFSSANDYTGKLVEGIDHYASTVLHEWTHLENYHDWWPEGYDRSKDADRDLVPDDREAPYGMNPTMRDTFGLGFRDVEVPAYLQEHTWTNGSCNGEDWSDPGKQSGGS